MTEPTPTSTPPPAKPAPAPKRDETAYRDAVERLLMTAHDGTPDGRAGAARLLTLYRLMLGPQNQNGKGWGADLGPVQAGRLILFCAQNGLDPSGSDVFMLGDRPYISLEGRLKLAFRSGKFDGFECDRPMTAEERASYGIPDGTFAWIASARRSDCKFPFVGVGEVNTATDRNPVAKSNILDMAAKRAREGALKLAFPADIDIGEAERRIIEATQVRDAAQPAAPPVAALPESTGAEFVAPAAQPTTEPVPVEARSASRREAGEEG